MTFHGVAFESGFDNYDELFLQAGFDRSHAVDFAGRGLHSSTSQLNPSHSCR